MTKEELKQEAEELIQRVEMGNSMNCFMQLTPDRKQIGEMLVMIAEPREKRIAELEKENAELKEKLRNRNCLDCSNHHNNIQLIKAKEIIRTFLMYEKGEAVIVEWLSFLQQAEQFLSDIKEG